MADVKVSGLPSDSSLDGNHYVPVNDPTGPTTKRTLLSTLAAFFFNQVNIPAGSGSPVTRTDEMLEDAVISGLVITGDSYGVNRNASMSSGIIYINGRRLSISSVSGRTYTASKDTYVDVLDNQDGTGTLVYTEVNNGVASPALAANSVRIGKVVTAAGSIAAASSITQLGSDSLSNLIYPNRLQKVTILRNSNGTNAAKKQSIIISGWGAITGNGTINCSEAVTFPVTFANVPDVIIASNGDRNDTTEVAGGGGNTVHGQVTGKAYGITTTGFTAYMWTISTGWTSGQRAYYGYIAMGEVL